ncbi:MAG: FAD-dependent oxidoreductase [Candidatus Nanoarchaeia archaeon]|jgi:thioredoxin reductase (NADPH)|nr:FAD-dependent oxidoreductase [Candidatus Nanoarchaeia archaeon]|tara:strand:- start:313 stop:1218 length:906 start_codon:yes stop_codon:yes gene_type:complete
MKYDVIIIGGGAAGLGAALYSTRYNLKTLIIAKEFGGTGNIAHKVDNWIGEPGISGLDLMNKFIKHVDDYKVPRVEAEVTNIAKMSDGLFSVKADKTYHGRTIIYALGMKHRELGIPGEKEFSGKGVHYCYTCDGPLYAKKNIAVIGGGDAAGLGSLFLSEYGKQVYTLVRKPAMRAEPITQDQMNANKKIKIMIENEAVEFYGEKMLQGIKLKNGRKLKVDAAFIEIGHIPLNDLAKKVRVKVNAHGFIPVDNTQKTNIKGFCAAGDITTRHTLKQFITSAAEGSVAAESVYNFIKNNKW